mmetsp:Transcript_21210/g.21616  ORF Transcript_21210/g.21616 Transcript_21210/m.21616 type:complete len:189 (-) Transcript_21210:104-670(-)
MKLSIACFFTSILLMAIPDSGFVLGQTLDKCDCVGECRNRDLESWSAICEIASTCSDIGDQKECTENSFCTFQKESKKCIVNSEGINKCKQDCLKGCGIDFEFTCNKFDVATGVCFPPVDLNVCTVCKDAVMALHRCDHEGDCENVCKAINQCTHKTAHTVCYCCKEMDCFMAVGCLDEGEQCSNTDT